MVVVVVKFVCQDLGAFLFLLQNQTVKHRISNNKKQEIHRENGINRSMESITTRDVHAPLLFRTC